MIGRFSAERTGATTNSAVLLKELERAIPRLEFVMLAAVAGDAELGTSQLSPKKKSLVLSQSTCEPDGSTVRPK
jgi:hypothetical protein